MNMIKFDNIFNFKGVHTFHLAMNQFGDLRSHEFVSIMNGFRPRSEDKVREPGSNCEERNNPPVVSR